MKGVINMLNKKQKQTIELITKMLKESGEQYTICANQSQIEKDPTKIFLHEKQMEYYRGQMVCLSKILLEIT